VLEDGTEVATPGCEKAVSSILDALSKKRENRIAPAGAGLADGVRSPGGRPAGAKTSGLRIALWVVSTVAVGAWVGLFLVYRLAALGLVAGNPAQAPASIEPAHGSGTASAAPLGVVAEERPSLPAVGGLSLAGRDLELVREAIPEAPGPSAPAFQPAAAAEPAAATAFAAPQNTAAEQPAPVPTPDARKFQLSGMMLDARQPMAIINGRLVGVGDQVEGYEVLAISKDGVRLEGWATLLQIHE